MATTTLSPIALPFAPRTFGAKPLAITSVGSTDQLIDVRVEVDPDWTFGTRLQIYADFGDGSVDATRALLPKTFDPYVGKQDPGGYGTVPYGSVPYGHVVDHFKGDGYGEYGYGDQPYGEAVASITVPVRIPDAYGTWIFSPEAIDAAGNVQTDALDEFTIVVSGRNPAPLRSVTLQSVAAGIAAWTFT